VQEKGVEIWPAGGHVGQWLPVGPRGAGGAVSGTTRYLHQIPSHSSPPIPRKKEIIDLKQIFLASDYKLVSYN
jgi:hypothetical protein